MTDGAGVPTGTPLTDPPLVEMISEDPVLRETKLIAEAWDCDGLNQARHTLTRLGPVYMFEQRPVVTNCMPRSVCRT